MRIKCPNSDIVLELPGDRTDMKFTCPACQKIHRVTVSITTPGEEGAKVGSTTVVRTQPGIPKKYATGAYAPVVDVPIDANFVLLDPAAPEREGVDLGMAAGLGVREVLPPFSERNTEIVGKDPAADAGAVTDQGQRADSEETVRDEDEASESRRLWEKVKKRHATAVHQPHATPTPAELVYQENEPSGTDFTPGAEAVVPAPSLPAWRGGGWVSAAVAVLVFVIAVGGGYLAWQQMRHGEAVATVDRMLTEAEAAWKDGNAEAGDFLLDGAMAMRAEAESLHTVGQLFQRVSGRDAKATAAYDGLDSRIRSLIARKTAFAAFRRGLDPTNVPLVAATLRDAIPAAAGDAPLLAAMEREAIDVVMEQLRATAGDLTPEEAERRSMGESSLLQPVLSPSGRDAYAAELADFRSAQRRRLTEDVRGELEAIAAAAGTGDAAAVGRYRDLLRRVRRANVPELPESLVEMAGEDNVPILMQVEKLSDTLASAVDLSRMVLSLPEEDASDAYKIVNGGIDGLMQEAREAKTPNAALAEATASLVDAARAQADDLIALWINVESRLESEKRRNRSYAGIKLAMSMLNLAYYSNGNVAVDPAAFRFDSKQARMEFTIDGLPGVMEMDEDDHENRIRASVGGYRFVSGWALFFHKPVTWMAELAKGMREAGVDAALNPEWELLEGPGGPLVLSIPGTVESSLGLATPAAGSGRQVFFQGRLYPVTELPAPGDSLQMAEDFQAAAKRLHDEVMADSAISQSLRQALMPVLVGTYQKPDPRDYFDSAFCRRLVEADYLETYLDPMPEAIRTRLAEYREALGKLEAGYDEFSVDLGEGATLFAVARPDADFAGEGKASDQDPETGETVPRFTWRVERADATTFYSPQPSRFVYAFMLAEHFDGSHKQRPAGVPKLTEVWHATRGKIATYADGDDKATGDVELWNAAIAEDSTRRSGSAVGPPGWNYPLHVLQRDDQGDPVLLATMSGIVRSPDFSALPDEADRRRAEDAWLDTTAATLSTPGELGLIFHQFFRYCSDSPLPELPNLIGSHYGLSDTHQTVYETLERRWVGRLIGDCDDLAEFFQVLTRRQGKLSHVMQLPGHAAAGWVEETDDDRFRFVVLQTGPVLQFVAPSLNEVVELAYRSFDRGDGVSHMTTDAVPLLLRFADEETRTPFVLSARIYGDAEYAETMIRVQGYWHEHAYSAAIRVMEDLVEVDQEVGNIKELGSLYERVGFYERSADMRNRELEMVREDNAQAALSTLLEIAQLHFQDKNRDKALEALHEMEGIMKKMVQDGDANEFFRAMTFRSYWAMFMSRLGEGARAWELVGYDVMMTKRQLGHMAEPVLRTLVLMYDRMCMDRDNGLLTTTKAQKALDAVRRELDEAFGRGYFKADDSYNTIIGRYFVLGRYAVSEEGRVEGLDRLLEDGPYATESKDHTKRLRSLSDEDWQWLRITPQLYYVYGMEMLDRDEYPEFYDPDAARPLLEAVARAVKKGSGLGSDVAGGDDVVKADMTLAFLNRDLDLFRRCMATVKEKDYSSLYDDAALTFGLNCGLIPIEDFQEWIDVFHEFFPGTQHYFKVVYRAIDKEHYDHALVMAEATGNYFPDARLLLDERDFVRSILPELKARKERREAAAANPALRAEPDVERPAA